MTAIVAEADAVLRKAPVEGASTQAAGTAATSGGVAYAGRIASIFTQASRTSLADAYEAKAKAEKRKQHLIALYNGKGCS